jgi:adenylate kinase family enzyme
VQDAGAVRIVIVGNAGSGKSTLARALAAQHGVAHLDLDRLFWEPERVAVKRPSADVEADLDAYCARHDGWVIEGCYGALAARLLPRRPRLIFLDPGRAECLRRCRERDWEPEKYPSRAAQDAQLGVLLDWVEGYYRRDDDMSHAGHRALFDAYDGPKEHRCAKPAADLQAAAR